MSDQYGIIVLKEGYTINDIDDPRSWAMNSKYKMFSVGAKGSGTLNGVPAQAIVNHGLGYIPLNFLYVEEVTSPGEYHLATGDTATGFPYVKNTPADPNNIYVLDEFALNQDFFYWIFHIPVYE